MYFSVQLSVESLISIFEMNSFSRKVILKNYVTAIAILAGRILYDCIKIETFEVRYEQG